MCNVQRFECLHHSNVAKDPYIFSQKIPMYFRKQVLFVCLFVPYTSANEPYIYNMNPIYIYFKKKILDIT